LFAGWIDLDELYN